MRRGWPLGLVALLASGAYAAPEAAPPLVDPALRHLLKAPTGCTSPDHPDEIVVCGRDREAARQALPFEGEHDDGDPRYFTVSRERNALVEDRSGQGPLSCESSIGPNGGAGCLARDNERWHEQHPGGLVPRPHPMIRPNEDVPPP